MGVQLPNFQFIFSALFFEMTEKNLARTKAEAEKDLAHHIPDVERAGNGYMYTGKVQNPREW